MRKTKFKNRTFGTNAIDHATTTSKDFGFIPVSGKGGKTTNYEIPAWMFDRELEEYKNGGTADA